jgi:tRNA/tmRNA/rRNA uracil-C5-methylase (TrmA/RlmC/RlmD family)
MTRGELTLVVLKPAAGGRMLARSTGGIVLVSGAIPGERVRARVERVGKGVTFAEVTEVLVPSPDRRATHADWRCGGQLLAHVAYSRQLQLKGEIVADAFSRIGKLPLPSTPPVLASPEHGYRMRARLHAAGGRLGFYREGTHEVCDPACTGQLGPEALAWIADAGQALRPDALAGISEVELAESIDGRERACHLVLRAGADAVRYGVLAGGLAGLTAQAADRAGASVVAGKAMVADVLDGLGPGASAVRIERQARAFFQSNRFLLRPLVEHVLSTVPRGPVFDFYAGVGLFGLSLAAAGCEPVTLVEGDPVSGTDLETNARPFGARARVVRRDVESFLAGAALPATDATVVLDPPRTGLSKLATAGVCRLAAGTVIYVSCDVATLARDARALLDAGYTLERLTGLDLFPNTAHVECVATFRRAR